MKMTLLVLAILSISPFAFGADDGAGVTSTSIKDNSSPKESVIRRLIPEFSFLSSAWTGSGTSSHNFDNTTSRPGYSVGLLADLGHSDVQFETGVLYRELGAVVTPNFAGANGGNLIKGEATTVTLRYISLPLMAVAYDNLNATQSVFVKAGMMVSALVSRDESVNFTTQNFVSFASFAGSSDLIAGIRNMELDAVLSAGGKIKLGSGASLIGELSYFRGLTSLYDSLPVYNSALSATAGFALEL